MFVRRLIDHLLNQVLVEGLANSRWFQRFAVWSHNAMKELQAKSKDQSAVLDTHLSSFFEQAKAKSQQLQKDFQQELRKVQEQQQQMKRMQLRNGTVVGANALPVQGRPLFEEGARLIFARWTALALAVENQWGGTNSAEKAEALLQDCLDWFYKKREHYADELEEELDDAILQDFNVEAEDGSPRQVSESLVKLYQELVAGTTTYLDELRAARLAGAAQSKRQVVDLDGTVVAEEDAGMDTSDDEDGEGDSDEDMDADGGPAGQAPQAVPLEPAAPRAPVVDEEGFTMVQGKGRRRR